MFLNTLLICVVVIAMSFYTLSANSAQFATQRIERHLSERSKDDLPSQSSGSADQMCFLALKRSR